MEQELASRALEAGHLRLDEIKQSGQVNERLIDEAYENTQKSWRKLGLERGREDSDGKAAAAQQQVLAAEVEAEVLTAARETVLSARTEQWR